MKRIFLVVMAVGCIALLTPMVAQAEVECLVCMENGNDDDTCDPPSNLLQWDNSFADCEVKERCFLGLICWQYCRITQPCAFGRPLITTPTSSGDVAEVRMCREPTNRLSV